MFNYKWQFEAAGRSWRARAEVGLEKVRYSVIDGETSVAEREFPSTDPRVFDPQTLTVETSQGPLSVTIGYLDWINMGCVVAIADAEVFRSSRRPFGRFGRMQKMMRESGVSDEDRAAAAQRMKERMPSVYVDIAMAVVFFVVARQFGLTTAAVSGAAITLVLFVVQRFLRVDLLGGFAVFGVVVSLLSAGAALAFQSDLAVKLRGTVIGLIIAGAFMADGAFGGRYLGARLAGYLETVMRLKPARAAFAMGGAGVAVAAIDFAAAFSLNTDQWLVYNAALDGLIAAPIVFAALWAARERPPV